jgi:cytosine/adenosine deaminase-related metal-dependent hydrolase
MTEKINRAGALLIALLLAWGGSSARSADESQFPPFPPELETLAPPARLLVKNALLMTMADGEREPFLGYMLVGIDGKIAKIGAGDPPPDAAAAATYDAGGKFVIPGFISAHSHIYCSPLRGTGADKTLIDWIGAWAPLVNAASPEDLYWYTLHGCLDFQKYGITAAYNFTTPNTRWNGYEKPPTPNPGDWEEKQFNAEIDSGLRFIHSFGVPFFGNEQESRQGIEKLIAYTKPFASDPHFLKLALSGGVGFARSKETAYREAAYMRDYNLDNQTHYLEPPTALSQRDKFPWFVESGLLAFGPRLYFGHFIHTTPEIVAAAAKAGCNMVWNPLSNGRLASGFADIPAYLKAGMKVGMGVDNQNASDIPDPFENMRLGLYAIRDKYEDATVMSPYDVLKLHTMGSATVMRVADKIGSLEPGKYADFDVVDPRHRDTGPVYDPYATLVLACGQANLDRVYIGGEMVSMRGQIIGRDFDTVAAEVRRRAEAARAKAATP